MSSQVSKSRPPARLLYAEDEAGVAMSIKMLLECEGFDVDHAPNGRLAVEKFRAAPTGYDVIVTDDNMPELTGLGLVEELRRLNYAGNVVVHSAVVDSRKERLYRAFGVKEFVHKLEPSRVLVEAIRRALEAAR
ncbi:MAG TPA: response regulator [Verrucomicrobiae bacterium]